ncbi:GH92 family glycosyl hydrolase [Gracilimonas mengyeensis]|uniref:Alpha-1,2-mannosidase, putative n=1 Tax=Gracilimonas mengyeensis TaxID=1302730 RepID=A0A521EYJ5_9BACT|nr:GH92 family glycosyl hydrolase [Gracilimonas mengyeensis]SMO88979.1 alpha-1,2-mannosidase, putative [Gracilimonas mengyeensis]
MDKLLTKLLLLLFVISSSVSLSAQQKQPVDYVDPLIGSHDSRWIMFPGPTMPFGMVKLSPDNQERGWKAGYDYAINNIAGFSHLHSWTMAGLLTVPANGELKIKPGTEKDPDRGYRSHFRHETEQAEPGYYSVVLDDYDVKAELTTTMRTGFHRYTFPESDSSRILIDLLTPSEYNYEIGYTNITKVSDNEIEGVSYQQSLRKANYNEYVLNFVIRFNKPFKSMNGWVKEEIYRNVEQVSSGFGHKDVGTFLEFETEEGEQIMMQTGISLVSVEQARLNLETELDHYDWDFEQVRADNKQTWNDLLSVIEVEGGSEENTTKFYTNLYRAYAGRTTWTDVNGKYMDMYEKVQQIDPDMPVYGSDGFWITFWNLNQLWSLATPDIANNWVNSMLEIYDKGGWLPKGPTGIEYSGIMVASHQISLLTNAYHKGIRNYDVGKMYEAIHKLQTVPGHPYEAGGYVGNRNLEEYIAHGYVPDEDGPVSNTLEYAYDDWTVAQMAKALGKEKDYKEFTKRAFNYKNVFDSEVGYMRRKYANGDWVENFSPFGDVTFLGSGWVEGNAWQFTYFVPHDVNGLIGLLGKDEFNDRLQKGFEESAPHKFNSEHLGDNSLHGMGVLPINHGNQPNMQAAYLFNYSGKPWLTQYWSREIMDNYYGTTPEGGWLGDEDQGQMGAWFVMSAMGLFQMDGGASVNPVYELGSPLFEKITIHLDEAYYPGGTFVIKANGTSKENRYIQSAKLDGKLLSKPWFYHKDLVDGGMLELEMGPDPNTNWGSRAEDAPPSLSTTLTEAEIDSIMAYDRQAEELAEWNRAVKAYYYHKKEHFENLPNTPDEILFLGDSITDNAEWAELFGNNPDIKNRGIGGDDTDGVLERLGEVTESQPDKVFIMIGTNDLAYGKSKEYVVDNYRKILDRIMSDSPDTEIYLQSVLPVDDQVHFTRPNADIEYINGQLQSISKELGLIYIDLASQFRKDGKMDPAYSIDGLHLNGEGYEVWKEEILRYVEE